MPVGRRRVYEPMARLPRIDVPGVPQHLIVRGNNRAPMFRDDADRMIFLRFLEEALEACVCDLHAYVLMNNHVHLLATGHVAGELSENSMGKPARPLIPHPVFLDLGPTDAERACAYRELVAAGISDNDLDSIRTSARQCRALGPEAFCNSVAADLARPAAPRRPGRPPKRGQAEKLT